METIPESTPVPDSGSAQLDDASKLRVQDLPKETGVMLVSVGLLGLVLPGMAGAPAILAGGLVLWPGTFGKLETWFERRFPKLHGQSMRQIERYVDDLNRRYPEAPGSE
jgi:hypothetical protein